MPVLCLRAMVVQQLRVAQVARGAQVALQHSLAQVARAPEVALTVMPQWLGPA